MCSTMAEVVGSNFLPHKNICSVDMMTKIPREFLPAISRSIRFSCRVTFAIIATLINSIEFEVLGAD